MKKNSFLEGTIIATTALIIVRILGLLYVIPFYAIVGTTGAALYSYAYTIYGLFLDISAAGVPTAVAKLINEFNTLKRQEAKVRVFKIGKKILGFAAITAFILLFVFAPQISKIIIDDMTGGNTVEDVTFVLRAVSFALLLFPFLGMKRGFFQGHNIISVSSFSQIIEQGTRILVIIVGSFLALKIFGFEMKYAIGIAVFGAFIGEALAYIYVSHKLKKHKAEFSLAEDFKEKDSITDKEIIKKIIVYAVPVIIITVANAVYNNIDMILVLRTMNNLGFDADTAEFVASCMTTWAQKISIIVTTIGMGISSSLVPHMVESFTLKKYKDVNKKLNKALEIVIFITIPMCVGISLLSDSVWTVFYGYSKVGTPLLAVSIFSALFGNIYSIANNTLQSMNRFKMVYISTILGFVLNAALDIPLMYLFNKFNLPPFWGASVATYTGFSLSFIITFIYLKKKYKFNYKSIGKTLGKTILPLVAMILVVVLLKIFIPLNYGSKMFCILFIVLAAGLGSLSYFIISYKMGLINEIFGKDIFRKIKRKFKKRNNKREKAN